MLFWTHAAIAYLIYRLSTSLFSSKTPMEGAVLILTGGALLPDLVDKPLSFLPPSLPSRAVAHSIFIAGLVLIIGGYLARRAHRFGYWIAYTTGYLSHLGADLIDPLFIPQETFSFLFWPIIADNHHTNTVGELLALAMPTPYVLAQTVVTLFVIGLWISDGKPGTRVYE